MYIYIYIYILRERYRYVDVYRERERSTHSYTMYTIHTYAHIIGLRVRHFDDGDLRPKLRSPGHLLPPKWAPHPSLWGNHLSNTTWQNQSDGFLQTWQIIWQIRW